MRYGAASASALNQKNFQISGRIINQDVLWDSDNNFTRTLLISDVALSYHWIVLWSISPPYFAVSMTGLATV
jgi:hypothetical protein